MSNTQSPNQGAFLMLNGRGTIEFADKSIEPLLGYSVNELLEKPFEQVFLLPINATVGQASMPLGKYIETYMLDGWRTYEALCKDGSHAPFELMVSCFPAERGQKYIVAIRNDQLSEKLRAELYHSQTLFNSLIEKTTDHIFSIDRDLTIKYINHVAPGLTKEQVVGSCLLDLLANDGTREMVENIMSNVFKTGEAATYHITFPVPDGTMEYSTIVSPIIENNKVKSATLITRDVTLEKRANMLVEESRRKLDIIIDTVQVGIITSAPDSKLLSVNDFFCQYLGYKKCELVGTSFLTHTYEEDIESSRSVLEQMLSGVIDSFTLKKRYIRKNGDVVWGKINLSVVKDKQGEIEYFVTAVEDITTAKMLEQQLVDKNKELENFVYMTSHDLKSPLNTVIGFVEMLQLQEEVKGSEEVREIVQMLNGVTGRMKGVVDSLLNHSRLGKNSTLEIIDCNILVGHVLADIHSDIQAVGAKLEFSDLPLINGFRTELHQLFQNLISNAIKFHKPNERPVIVIDAKMANDKWRFSIKDNGIGIAADDTKKIFNIFTRLHTQSEYSGTGIGLANCKKIVEMHKGNIWVESEEGKGSTFIFELEG